MQITEHANLKQFNSFGMNVTSRYMVEVNSEEDVKELIASDLFKQNDHLILGGGSNVLLTDNFEGVVVRNVIAGREVVEENKDFVKVKFGSGENWHDCVLWTIENDWGGIENLSLIPGTIGAAPMQNIGAYGVEIKDVFEELSAIHLETGMTRIFRNNECEFGYRESVFKKELKGKYLITSVTLRLSKKPDINISYGAIAETLNSLNIADPTISDVSRAVIQIRQSKLPDPAEIGNAGSFFKNPTIPSQKFEDLKASYPNIPGYPQPNDQVKVPAGWLIENCGWKGKTIGEIGVHKNQALVLVNYGNGRGKDIENLSKEIRASVREKFGIELTPEVNII
ncbi:MAG: UDP-N-acetylmuramate dehydrogenase [bacterium]|nr:UDP-N-acetylmuramate dehydrogenase [bacterium]